MKDVGELVSGLQNQNPTQLKQAEGFQALYDVANQHISGINAKLVEMEKHWYGTST